MKLPSSVKAPTSADLSKIDRRIRKEPVYHTKPQYFLLVFGQEAERRVWVVIDGEDLYADANSNGDLTEPEKKFRVPGGFKVEGYDSSPITIRINPPNLEGIHCGLAYVQGRYMQSAPIKPAGSPDVAPIYHFHGPFRIDLFEPKKLIRNYPNPLSIAIGTPTEIEGTIAQWVEVYLSESIPRSVRPHVEIEYPGKEDGVPPIRTRVSLQPWQASFIATVRVPEEAGPGSARVYLSFPEWKSFDVAPCVRELPLTEASPEDEERVRWREIQPRLIDEKPPVVDLAKIDRSVPTEPDYKSKPQYCLLLLGPEAKTRIWLVLDGDTLYVDRNGRGSWIEADKKRDADHTLHFGVPEIEELDGTRHTDLNVYAAESRIHPGKYHFGSITLVVKGRYGQYTCIDSIDHNSSTESPQAAPVRHFNGPLRMELVNQFAWSLGDPSAEVHASICTKYLSGEWAYVFSSFGIPVDIHPVAEIEFPNSTPDGPPINLKVALSQRC